MKSTTFDTLARSLTKTPTRRGLLHVFAMAVGIGLAENRRPDGAEAKKKNKKPKNNEFGCVSVGKACNGKDRKCCSGICKGKRPKKGKKDKSKCIAHNTGLCRDDQDFCLGDETLCGTEDLTFCFRTTGKASFCGALLGSACFVCSKDTDCEPVFGPGAACIACDCVTTNSTACVPPAV